MMKKPVTVTRTKSGSVLYLAAAGPGHLAMSSYMAPTRTELTEHTMITVIQDERVYSKTDSATACSLHV